MVEERGTVNPGSDSRTLIRARTSSGESSAGDGGVGVEIADPSRPAAPVTPLLADRLSDRLDRFVRPEIPIRGQPRSAFQLSGYVGLASAVSMAMLFVVRRDLSWWVMALVVVGAVGSFFGLAMLTKIVTGKEDLVYYRHEIAVIAVATALLRLLHQPVLSYLDGTVLGVGLFLACGRIGCLMVGCCHGRPHAFGVRYRAEYAEAGFPPALVGVRLFPTQLVESLYVLVVVGIGSVLAWNRERPGAGLVAYVAAYAIGRYVLEFWRGDAGRLYVAGFSEAQWSSLALLGLVALAEQADALPGESWHVVVFVGLVLITVLVAARRWRRKVEHAWLQPGHVLEIAEALDRVARPLVKSGSVDVARTSLGIRVSGSTVAIEPSCFHHYTLSSDRGLTGSQARELARLIGRLKHPCSAMELIPGNQGVFHVLVHPTI